jgi:D-xylose transport system permease protein
MAGWLIFPTEKKPAAIRLFGKLQSAKGKGEKTMQDKKGGVFSDKNMIKNIGFAVIAVVMLFVFNSITNNTFISQRNLTMLFKQSAVLMILASSLMVLLIEKNFDLAGGAGVYLTGVVVAILVVRHGVPLYIAIPAGLLLGLVMGMANGFFIGYLSLPAFIVTLAAQQMFRGIGYTLTNAATVGPMPRQFSLISEAYIPPGISFLIILIAFVLFVMLQILRFKKMKEFSGGIGTLIRQIVISTVIAGVFIWIFYGYKGFPMAVIIALCVASAMYFVTTKTVFGRHAYIIGGNIEAAYLAGVRTKRRIFQAYILEGLMYGIGGIVLTARLGGAAATGGNLLELDAVAAACIGGTSMNGGVGTIGGMIIGSLILTAIDNVMSLMNVSSYLQLVIKGLILLLAICLDFYVNKSQFRFRLKKA